MADEKAAVQNSIDSEITALRNLAVEADRAGLSPVLNSENQEQLAAPTDKENKSSEAKADEQVKSDVESKSEAKPEVKAGQEKEAPKAEADPIEDLKDLDARLEKDKQRLAKSWKKHSEEKAAWKVQQDEIARQAALLAEENRKLKSTAPSSKYTPEQLRKWAKDYEAEGKEEMAKTARLEAAEIEDAQVRSQTERKRYQEDFNSTWEATKKACFNEFPELAKEGSELRDKTQEILNRKDSVGNFINSLPDGLRHATQLADMMIKADLASDLQKENADLREKLKTRDKQLAPSGSSPREPKGSKSFDEMTVQEQTNFLRKQAQEADLMAA